MKDQASKRLYFVAIVAPEPVQSEVTEMKQLARELFGSGHALNSPAHITIIPPFYATPDQIDALAADMENYLRTQNLPPVRLDGFDHFGNRVIYVDVLPDPRWNRIQRDLFALFKKHFPGYRKPNRFHPHMTIAFRDLDPAVFDDAWNYFNAGDYEAVFPVDNLQILQHRNKRWHPYRTVKANTQERPNE